MKKISFVLEHLCLQGAEYATAMMANGFVADGYEVEIIVSQHHADYLRQGIRPFPVSDRVVVKLLRHRKARENIRELRHYLKTTDAQVIVCMSENYSLAVRLAAIGLLRHPKLVHVEHGLAGIRDDYSVIDAPRPMTGRWFRDWWYWNKFDRILTVSEFGRGDFARVHPHVPMPRIFCVYNPVVNDVFREKMQCKTSHPWLLDKPCYTFVTAGAHEDYKGHMTLLEAMLLLKMRGERIRVVIFGRGGMTQKYEDFIAQNDLTDNVSLGGYTNNFPAEAKSADAFVLPSELESFGIVLVEALACGLPVVSTDAPYGPKEILEGGKYGKLVPVKNPMALADAMAELAHAPKTVLPPESWNRFTLDAAVVRYKRGIGLSDER